MKLIIILIGIIFILYLLKERYNPNFPIPMFFSEQPYNVDVKFLYTIQNKKYENITTKINLSEEERNFLMKLNNSVSSNYSLRVIGGWVRDKVNIIYILLTIIDS
jgi:hypothetical protein